MPPRQIANENEGNIARDLSLVESCFHIHRTIKEWKFFELGSRGFKAWLILISKEILREGKAKKGRRQFSYEEAYGSNLCHNFPSSTISEISK